MVEPRALGIVTMVGGGLLGLVSASADMLGITTTPGSAGDIQWIGIAAGSILFILGLTIFLLTLNPKNL